MTGFAVWAPRCSVVELVLEGAGRLAMHQDTGGWWRVDVDGAGAGTRYWFSLEGGPPRPDPRSPWQPEGITGPSAVVDHGSYRWGDGAWRGRVWPPGVLYELHVGTFTDAGTFDAAIERLHHLRDLGIAAIELLPVAEGSGGRGWGYDGVLWWAPHHAYGGPDGLKRLVDAAHQQGLAVILDVVYNHFGPAGNYTEEFGPYLTDRYRTPWGPAINFDGHGSDEVRRFVIDNACMWLENYHVDGLRLDAVHAIVDLSAVHILEELAEAVDGLSGRLGRPLWLVAEDDRNDPRPLNARSLGGYGLDAAWNDEFHHALHASVTGERTGYYLDFGAPSQLARAYEKVYVHGRDFSPFRDRHHGRPVGELPGRAFVVCAQNHDQVGNRAAGERLAALAPAARARLAAALVLLSPFVPLLFMGEEWAASTPWLYFTDHADPELGRAVREGRRREFAAFGWRPEDIPDPQDPATRERSVLPWGEAAEEPHAAMLRWYRDLIRLRQELPDLAGDDRSAVSAVADDEAGWLRLRRGRVWLVANLGRAPATVALEGAGPWELLLASGPDAVGVGPHAVRVSSDAVAVVAPAAVHTTA
ncbi:MAG: malto-oligosyltrehalose trehalohydrolase [Acidimicrobiaceae bacterium]|nr:malto-oligosyltrehalose trehalohydrolase [Acidimicrobiaceae bacterium]